MRHLHPRFAALLLAFSPSATEAAFESFEGDGFGDWEVAGSAFGLSPVHGKLDGMEKGFAGYSNEAFALSAHGGDAAEDRAHSGAVLTPGYGITSITFKNGTNLGGTLLEETPEPEAVDPAKLPGAKPQSRRSPFDQVLIPISTAGDADAVKIGRQQFMICGACHGQQGEGTAAGPPLAGSEWVNGPVENLIRIQLRGLNGPIKVKGQEYIFPAGMVAMAYQTDEQIAAVLTHVRSNFGNDSPAVSPEEVASLRDEVGKPQLTAGELIQPEIAPAAVKDKKYDNIGSSSGFPFAVVGGVLAIGGLCVFAFFRK